MAQEQQAMQQGYIAQCNDAECYKSAYTHSIFEHQCHNCNMLGHFTEHCGDSTKHRSQFENLSNNDKIAFIARMDEPDEYGSLYCRVNSCKKSETHLTAYHQCEKCHNYGHGKNECGDSDKKKKKLSYLNEISKNDFQPSSYDCTLISCEFRYTHRTAGHFCVGCGEHGGNKDCDNCDSIAMCESCEQRGNHKKDCEFLENEIRKLEMMITKLKGEQAIIVKCPLCRKHNLVNVSTAKVPSLSGDLPENYDSKCEEHKNDGIKLVKECSCCKSKYADVILPECKHTACCIDCLEQLKI